MVNPTSTALTTPTALPQTVASQVGRSASQVVLRWALQQGLGVLPSTSSVEFLRQDFDLYDFELTPAHMAAIDLVELSRLPAA